MKFENAYNGVKLLFIAAIILIACTLSTFIAALCAATAPDTSDGSASLFTIFSMIAAIISVTAGITAIFGFHTASKDQKYFTYSFFFIMVAVVLNVVAAFLKEGERVRRVLELLVTMFEHLTLIYAVYAIVQLSKQLENKFVEKMGITLLIIIFVLLTLSVASDLIIILTGKDPTVTAIVDITDSALAVAAYVVYVVYLFKAEKMLAPEEPVVS